MPKLLILSLDFIEHESRDESYAKLMDRNPYRSEGGS